MLPLPGHSSACSREASWPQPARSPWSPALAWGMHGATGRYWADLGERGGAGKGGCWGRRRGEPGGAGSPTCRSGSSGPRPARPAEPGRRPARRRQTADGRTEGRTDGRGAQGDRAGERVGPTRAAEGRRGSCAHRRRAGRTSVFPRWLRDAGLWPGPSGRPRAQGSIGPQGTDRAVARSPVPLRPAGPVRFGRVWPWGGAGTRGS